MAPREDDSGHKLIAVVNPKLCVSCGVCIGSCSFMAMMLGNRPAEPLWDETAARWLRAIAGRAGSRSRSCSRASGTQRRAREDMWD